MTKIKKQATTIEEQIALLKNRGMFIGDEDKAKEILMDIGYYRLGFIGFLLRKHILQRIEADHIFL